MQDTIFAASPQMKWTGSGAPRVRQRGDACALVALRLARNRRFVEPSGGSGDRADRCDAFSHRGMLRCGLRGFRARNRATDPQCLAAADDGVGIIRVQTQRGLERGNGVIDQIELQQDLSEIAIDLGMRGLPADQLAVGIRRFRPGASRLQRLPSSNQVVTTSGLRGTRSLNCLSAARWSPRFAATVPSRWSALA